MQRGRAIEATTALLQGDDRLARTLVVSDPNPRELAYDGLVILAGLIRAHASAREQDPEVYWRGLLHRYHAAQPR